MTTGDKSDAFIDQGRLKFADKPPKPGNSQGTEGFQRKQGLPTPGFQTSVLQNYKERKFR